MDRILTAVAVLGLQALGMLGLWLRLRWRVRHEQVRGRSLANLARALRGGGDIEDQRSDGSRIRLSIPHELDDRGRRG